MKKFASLLIVLIIFLAGYAIGHHVPRITIDPDAVDLLIVNKLSASTDSGRAVLQASYNPDAQSPQSQSGEDHGVLPSKFLQEYHNLRKGKLTGPPVTTIESWSTCVPDKNVSITFVIYDDSDQDTVNITVKPKK